MEGKEPQSLPEEGIQELSQLLYCSTYQLGLEELGYVVGRAEGEDEEDVLVGPGEGVAGGDQAGPVPVEERPANCTVSRKENELQKILIFLFPKNRNNV